MDGVTRGWRSMLTAGMGLLMVFTIMQASAYAAMSDTISVSFTIDPINEINIAGTSLTLRVNAAVAGSQPTQVSQSTTYSISTNCVANTKKLTAAINSAMPAGLTLSINVTAPTGAVSSGTTVITNVAANVVTGIDAVAQSDLAVTFYLNATAAAGVVSAASKTLTLTLVDA